MNREFTKDAVLALIEEEMNHYDEYEDAKEFNALYDIYKAVSEMEVKTTDEKAEKHEFIVEYNPHCLKITCTEYGEEGKLSQLEYKYNALHRRRGLKYGDIATWNNAFWCSVIAASSKEAFDIFAKKMEEKTNE